MAVIERTAVSSYRIRRYDSIESTVLAVVELKGVVRVVAVEDEEDGYHGTTKTGSTDSARVSRLGFQGGIRQNPGRQLRRRLFDSGLRPYSWLSPPTVLMSVRIRST